MPQNLDITLIRSFLAVAEHGSMTAAAARLHLTQGAISQHIRRLEEGFGVSLFERDRPRLRLSTAGERLLGRAQALLALNDELAREMRGEGSAMPLRLGVPPDLLATGFAPILKAFADAHPQVEVQLTCATSPVLTEGYAAGTLDLAVVEAPVGQARGECLRREALVWAGGRASDVHRKRPLPVSLVDATCAFRPVVMEALRSRNVEWRTVYENGNFETNVATVNAGLAVSAFLASVVPEHLQ
ncbi:MAG TPA: LysR family transcriptional regulator, partial [Burkholderiales bacterium]